MKTWLAALAMALTAGLAAPLDAEAKRLGGGKSLGMQRSSTPDAPKPAPGSTPPQQGAAPAATGTPGAATAAAPAAATGAAAAAGKRSWLGPIAGIAAGLGLVALMSSLGLGEEFANFLMLALLAVAAIALVMFLMRRFGRGAAAAPARGPQLAAAGGAPFGGFQPQPEQRVEPMQRTPLAPAPVIGSALGSAAAVPVAASTLPADFDVEGFERIAKAIFVRMQDANDRGNLDDLRQFTTPELFSHLRVDLLDRGAVATATEVVAVDARVLEVTEVTEEGGRQVVSVGYRGQVREEAGAVPADFDEVWHLVRPTDGSRNWAIAGIQQRA